MERPDAAAVRSWVVGNDGTPTFDFGRFGYPEPEGDTDRLDRPVAIAVAYVEQITGRQLDASLPANLQPLAEEAVFLRIAQALAGHGNARAIRDALDQANVQSLRAGDFAVTFRSGGREKNDTSLHVNPWDQLNEILLLLMTPERRAELLAEQNGTVPPAMVGVEVADDLYGDWRGSPYGFWP